MRQAKHFTFLNPDRKPNPLTIPMGNRNLKSGVVRELVISMEEKEGPNYKVMEDLIIDYILL